MTNLLLIPLQIVVIVEITGSFSHSFAAAILCQALSWLLCGEYKLTERLAVLEHLIPKEAHR